MSDNGTKPQPQPGILDISLYVPGEDGGELPGKVIKLSSNETPLGASPAAIAAYNEQARHLHIYPDGSAAPLRKAIAKRYGLDTGRIICGAGSDEILSLLAQAYLGPGDEAIHTAHGFLMYEIVIRANGGAPVAAPERDLTADVDEILALVNDKTRLVFLANPNNPTGTYLPNDEIRRLRAALRADIILVIDAAYAEYVDRNDYEAGIELVAMHDNVVMTRTFSKIHGLAALRVGWAYCPAAIADVLNRMRGPFNVNMPAMMAAVAAIEDIAHMERARDHNTRWRGWLEGELKRLKLDVVPSAANFVLIRFPGTSGKTARDADRFLQSRGLILRRLESYHLGDCLRMSVGEEDANKAVIAALESFMGGAET